MDPARWFVSELTIQDLPDELRQGLETRAARNRRSTSREAVAILEEVLGGEELQPTVEDALRDLPIRGAAPLN